jgi:hypothetical protein
VRRWTDWALLVLKIAAALVASIAAFIGAMAGAGRWELTDTQALLTFGSASLIAVVASWSAAAKDVALGTRSYRRERIAQHVRTIFWQVYDATRPSLDPRDIGVAAYRVRREWPWFWRRYLDRLYRERPRSRQESLGVRWRPGKGVIGRAVAENGFAHLDVAAAWAPYRECSRAEWEELSPDITLGLTYKEFVSVRTKEHGVVVAMPITSDNDDTVVGCVVVDGPTGRHSELTTQAVRSVLADGAAGIAPWAR